MNTQAFNSPILAFGHTVLEDLITKLPRKMVKSTSKCDLKSPRVQKFDLSIFGRLCEAASVPYHRVPRMEAEPTLGTNLKELIF